MILKRHARWLRDRGGRISGLALVPPTLIEKRLAGCVGGISGYKLVHGRLHHDYRISVKRTSIIEDACCDMLAVLVVPFWSLFGNCLVSEGDRPRQTNERDISDDS